MRYLGIIIDLYRRIFWSLEKQACHVGVKMGTSNFVSSRFWSSEPYLISIGSNCQITDGVRFYTHGGAGAARRDFPKFDTFGRIIVGDFVYFGSNTMIMPGVTIGDNVLIAGGSVVTKSIPSNVVVGGNPARFICGIDDYIKKNLKYNTNTKGLDAKSKRDFLLKLSDDKFIKKPFIKIERNEDIGKI